MAFDPERFKKDLVYHTRAEVDLILRDVRRIKKFDVEAEAKLAKIKLIGICAVFGALALGYGIGWSFAGGADRFGAGLIGAFATAIVTGISFGVYHSSMQRLDLTDRRYQWIKKVLTRLAVDMHPDAQVELKVDFEPMDSSRKVKRKGSRGRYSVKYIQDPWLTLRGQFMDGTRFQLTLDEEVESRVHAKGHKRKLKRRTTLKLLLRPKEKRYGGLERLRQGAEEVVQLPSGLSLGRFEVLGDRISISAVKKHKSFNESPAYRLDLDKSISMMFLSAYQVLNLSRRMTRKGA